jgi:DNA-binding Lrp family transcriptional regulator
MHEEGSAWRMNALSRQQSRDAAAHLVPPDPGRRISPVDVALVDALAADGRASVASLAHVLDAPASTVHRRLQRLLASRQVTIRCDVAPELSGWLLEWSWLTTVAPSNTARVVEFLKSQPDLRLCASVTGANNLVFSFRSATMSGLTAFEAGVADALPGLAPTETLVHLRTRKRVGWILDEQGRCTGRLVAPVFSG